MFMGPSQIMSGPCILLGMCLLLLCLVPSLEAAFGMPDFLEFGTCLEGGGVELDTYKYSGIWFTQEMVPNEYTNVEQCAFTNYTHYDDVMTIVERGLSAEGKKLKKQTLMYPDEDEPNTFYVDSPGVPTAPYKILSTDYTGYSCTYSCMEFMGFKAEFFWTFTRNPKGDPKHVKHCKDVFDGYYFNTEALEAVSQGETCPYWHKVDKFKTYNQYIQDTAAKKAPVTKASSTTTTTPATTTTSTTTTTTPRPRPVVTSRPTTEATIEITSQKSTKNAAEMQQLDDLHTVINNEEKLLVELEKDIHEEEEELLHLIEEEQDLREKNYRTSRKNLKHRHRTSGTEEAAPTVAPKSAPTSAPLPAPKLVEDVTGSAVDLSSSAIMAFTSSLLVYLRATLA